MCNLLFVYPFLGASQGHHLVASDAEGIFLCEPFDTREVQRAVNRLHTKKSCGFDNIIAEHVKYGGPLLILRKPISTTEKIYIFFFLRNPKI